MTYILSIAPAVRQPQLYTGPPIRPVGAVTVPKTYSSYLRGSAPTAASTRTRSCVDRASAARQASSPVRKDLSRRVRARLRLGHLLTDRPRAMPGRASNLLGQLHGCAAAGLLLRSTRHVQAKVQSGNVLGHLPCAVLRMSGKVSQSTESKTSTCMECPTGSRTAKPGTRNRESRRVPGGGGGVSRRIFFATTGCSIIKGRRVYRSQKNFNPECPLGILCAYSKPNSRKDRFLKLIKLYSCFIFNQNIWFFKSDRRILLYKLYTIAKHY